MNMAQPDFLEIDRLLVKKDPVDIWLNMQLYIASQKMFVNSIGDPETKDIVIENIRKIGETKMHELSKLESEINILLRILKVEIDSARIKIEAPESDADVQKIIKCITDVHILNKQILEYIAIVNQIVPKNNGET
jgi:hypothetical protein